MPRVGAIPRRVRKHAILPHENGCLLPAFHYALGLCSRRAPAPSWHRESFAASLEHRCSQSRTSSFSSWDSLPTPACRPTAIRIRQCRAAGTIPRFTRVYLRSGSATNKVAGAVLSAWQAPRHSLRNESCTSPYASYHPYAQFQRTTAFRSAAATWALRVPSR